ncbi:hypothetical protein KP001_21575 [Geomonas subterranea]|uniref:Partitioning protein ParB n=1 Tax=Geomonas subterranea TaxID=2847989 RepID=A0ABX8LJ49_9BACT|nr:hypothetical protein [Geomonas subterranea]QXE90931.1 hypothetical protein KP001_21575 [Geomonas subterranea]QXM10983.1 hypothetical protein KP002_07695 [Geomonas subterranea]
MSDLENQMGLFELAGIVETSVPPQAPPAPAPHPEPKPRPKQSPKPAAAAPAPKTDAPAARPKKRGRLPKGAVKAVSGLVPEGDVRLTANIRQDLHLKLKIASAYRRITIGEIIEELVEKYV